jgi:RNA-directed DNA polymerase
MQDMRRRMKAEWRALQGHNVSVITQRLNPIIRGQANYYRTKVSYKAFVDLDNYMWVRARRYAKLEHPRKSAAWRTQRYWGQLNGQRRDNWVFGDKRTGTYLLKYKWFKIERHALVRGTVSPDDPAMRAYFAERTHKATKAVFNTRLGRIAARTKWVCMVCHQPLNCEHVEMHHLLPRAQGGSNDLSNLVLIHTFCHQQMHSDKPHYGDMMEATAAPQN